ncbi:hypothetical protein BS47DRAFT_1486265 [Hydnum rufescens UP504]|uniref:Uncharacterized protein n=1 Tax=Hydnum rufescens UP504 TaxID=1448309 RepID=A0A9P6AUX5_9AGAM|nr:hypothetical protein BS47DRAFT_1486265 [Hydnum rufescens UP504]
MPWGWAVRQQPGVTSETSATPYEAMPTTPNRRFTLGLAARFHWGSITHPPAPPDGLGSPNNKDTFYSSHRAPLLIRERPASTALRNTNAEISHSKPRHVLMDHKPLASSKGLTLWTIKFGILTLSTTVSVEKAANALKEATAISAQRLEE